MASSSQPRANAHARSPVGAEIPSAAAVSSTLSPAKDRSRTTAAESGSTVSSERSPPRGSGIPAIPVRTRELSGRSGPLPHAPPACHGDGPPPWPARGRQGCPAGCCTGARESSVQSETAERDCRVSSSAFLIVIGTDTMVETEMAWPSERERTVRVTAIASRCRPGFARRRIAKPVLTAATLWRALRILVCTEKPSMPAQSG